jgi:nitronate monooxygenase
VCEAGGLGFLAAGYLAPDRVAEQISALRGKTERPFGVNVFAPPGPPGDAEAVNEYASELGREAEPYDVEVGEPRHHDDGYADKLALLAEDRVPVISFTFGCPATEEVERLHAASAEVWVTVTTPDEARLATDTGADALVVQGVEAGGHRGSFGDDSPGDIGLIALLQLVRAETELPLVATGGIVTGRAVAAVLVCGAAAAQLGTAFMLTPEAATSSPLREALAGDAPTAVTRAFTGRSGRGVVNRFMRDHGEAAPSAYPEVHHLTAPLRAAARERGDPDTINLWAGQAYPLAREVGAGELVRQLAEEARQALQEAGAGLPSSGL